MSGFAIPENVIEAGVKALVETYWSGRSELDDPAVEAAIRAALAEWGATEERRGKMFPAKREGFNEHRDTERRIVTSWQPIDSEPERQARA